MIRWASAGPTPSSVSSCSSVAELRCTIGEPPPPARMNGSGKRWAITLLPGEPPAPQRPPYVDAVFAFDDPKPGLVHLARVVRSAVR